MDFCETFDERSFHETLIDRKFGKFQNGFCLFVSSKFNEIHDHDEQWKTLLNDFDDILIS